MKCECKECGGTGSITCPECDGIGGCDVGIEDITLTRNMRHYDELLALQKDTKRCRQQADRLCEINPQRRDSYIEQLKGCLAVIEGQAERLEKRK